MSVRSNAGAISVGRVVAGVLVATAAVALAVGVLLLAVENRSLRDSQECRFDIEVEVDSISDRIDQATARGLVALAEEDEAGLGRQIAIIREETALLTPAIERRSQAVEVCE